MIEDKEKEDFLAKRPNGTTHKALRRRQTNVIRSLMAAYVQSDPKFWKPKEGEEGQFFLLCEDSDKFDIVSCF
jgi:hypothetical protein